MQDYNEYKAGEIEEKLRFTYLQSVWISRFVWSKKIPSYEKLMKPETKKAMTAEEMLNEVKKLNTLFGGKVVKEE